MSYNEMNHDELTQNVRFLKLQPSIVNQDTVKIRVWISNSNGDVFWEQTAICGNNAAVYVARIEMGIKRSLEWIKGGDVQ